MRSRLRRSVYGGPAAAPARARPTHRRHSRRRAIVRTRPIVGMPNRPGRYAVLGRGCVATIRHVATQHNMLQHSTTCCERSCRLLFAVDCTGCARLNSCTASSSCRAQWAELTTTVGRFACHASGRTGRCTPNVAGCTRRAAALPGPSACRTRLRAMRATAARQSRPSRRVSSRLKQKEGLGRCRSGQYDSKPVLALNHVVF